MSVRLWLMEAECWQCETRIEISEGQRAAIELAQKRADPQVVLPTRIDPIHTTPPMKLVEPVPPIEVRLPKKGAADNSPVPLKKPVELPSKPLVIPVRPAVVPPRPKSQPIQAPPVQLLPKRKRSTTSRVIDFLSIAPAWLVSLLAHLVLLLILAILTTDHEQDRGILLSMAFSPVRQKGDIESLILKDTRAFDLPLPKAMNPDDPNDAGIIKEASKFAGQLQQTNYSKGFEPPPLHEVKAHLHQPYATTSGLLSRDIRVRSEVLRSNGGTLLTEASVARALRWIAAQQKSDGAWRLDSFSYEPGRGEISSKPAATALALLPFLGAGQTHRSGMYREQVREGLDYLLKIQGEDGDLRGGTEGEAGMYVHGQATIVLGEAYAMTKDPRLLEPVEKAVAFIVGGQHRQGGWRYQPKMAGDTSVLGWQLMALQSARMAGLEVPERTLVRANSFLDSVANTNKATYGYMPGQRPSPNMTAEAILCRLYLGTSPDDESLKRGLKLLMRDYPPSRDHVDYYYWYYATQAFHHVGGTAWNQWNESLQGVILEKQMLQGKNAGSWNVEGYLAEKGGRLYVTSLATCTLEVYYRHLPLFESIRE